MNDAIVKFLFIVGNKRSGTSQLVRILNKHPGIFVSHESDIVWILHQFHSGQSLHAHHPWDSSRGMNLTLDTCGHLLRPELNPAENFKRVQLCVMKNGNPWMPPSEKKDIKWLGDKKPFQHADPRLWPFIRDHFPGAHFLHIVRHPFAVAESSNKFNQTPDGDFWEGLSLEEKVEKWTFHEQQVEWLRRQKDVSLHTLRYEDFCRHTSRELSKIFRFLKLPVPSNMLEQASDETMPPVRNYPRINCSHQTRQLARQYGYNVNHCKSTILAWLERKYCRLLKALRN